LEDGLLLEHGGNIVLAAKHYGIPEPEWLDLSTGINPQGWPVTDIPTQVWQRLPESKNDISQHACNYYGCRNALAVPGSQSVIQLLPTLKEKCCVGVVSPTYAEHAYAWQQQGHDVQLISESEVENKLLQLDVLVVVNPNNPTGKLYSQKTLLNWQQQLAQKGGWLIVDEAFMDTQPENSLAEYSHQRGLIVLKSLGKFFGLAGIRCGFILAADDLLQQLQHKLGPWPVNGPALYIAAKALADLNWHQHTRERLQKEATRLDTLLAENDFIADGGTNLFQWLRHGEALTIHEALAEKGIFTRYFEPAITGIASIRFGLPGNEQQWQRLASALSAVRLPTMKASGG
jgi:cobalamin biosynthetic protein CobC